MNKIWSDFLYFYDKDIVNFIRDKYDISYMKAFQMFVNSKTYSLLENEKCAMYEFGSRAIFDMWESEKITGTPHNSVYLRSEV